MSDRKVSTISERSVRSGSTRFSTVRKGDGDAVPPHLSTRPSGLITLPGDLLRMIFPPLPLGRGAAAYSICRFMLCSRSAYRAGVGLISQDGYDDQRTLMSRSVESISRQAVTGALRLAWAEWTTGSRSRRQAFERYARSVCKEQSVLVLHPSDCPPGVAWMGIGALPISMLRHVVLDLTRCNRNVAGASLAALAGVLRQAPSEAQLPVVEVRCAGCASPEQLAQLPYVSLLKQEHGKAGHLRTMLETCMRTRVEAIHYQGEISDHDLGAIQAWLPHATSLHEFSFFADDYIPFYVNRLAGALSGLAAAPALQRLRLGGIPTSDSVVDQALGKALSVMPALKELVLEDGFGRSLDEAKEVQRMLMLLEGIERQAKGPVSLTVRCHNPENYPTLLNLARHWKGSFQLTLL